ncbi:MAG TPA: ribonuclease P protein component, partial [Longimicrobiaceae bacterium]|nr:ribonuclease P protein component [Longimicrobiaceae bacterium]
RVRRRLREAYRRRRGLFPEDLAMVLVGRAAALTADFDALLADIAAAQATISERAAAERERRRGRPA